MIKTGLDKIQGEIDQLKLLNHPNVVRLHEVIDDEEDDKLYIGKDNSEGLTIGSS